MTGRYVWLVAGSTVLYWAVFWTFNGLDKFLHGRNLLVFHWHGKDRAGQFGSYFQDIGINASLTEPMLLLTGVWELALGLLFAGVLYRLASDTGPRAVLKAMSLGTTASILTFIGFSAFDVVSGDRAELLEHGVYMMLLLVSWLTVGMSQSQPSRFVAND